MENEFNTGFSLKESGAELQNAVIKVIGVGGGGGNMLNYMIEKGIENIELIAANTDAQALNANKAPIKIQLGKELTKGLGAGMEPEKGRAAAQESYEDIKKALQGADLVFISAGMGGGTGTGAAPVIAQIAKELGALTIGIVTKPFKREGRKRLDIAEVGFNELKKECDSIVTILNQKLLSVIDRRASKKAAYRMIDDILYQAVFGITTVILSHSEGAVNLDFADLTKVISHKGMALMGIGHKTGENSAYDALSEAIESPLLDDTNIEDARGLLIHVTTNEDEFAMIDYTDAVEAIFGDLIEDDKVDLIEGQTHDPEMAPDEIKIVIIATGFDEAKPANNKTNAIKTNELDLNKITSLKVVGGDDFTLPIDSDELDKPTWYRQSRD